MKNFKSFLHYSFSRPNVTFARISGLCVPVNTSHGAKTFYLFYSLLNAQTLPGKITDVETGKPLVSTNVTLENSVRGITTNQQGI